MRKLSAVIPILAGAAGVSLFARHARQQPTTAGAAYYAFKAIEGATQVGIAKVSYDALLQKAAAELLTLKDVARSAVDSQALAGYSAALVAYADAETVWTESIDDSKDDFIPAGDVYVEQNMLPIVDRYHLTTESHTIPSTGARWQSIPQGSIQVIWVKAAALAGAADSIVVPHLPPRS